MPENGPQQGSDTGGFDRPIRTGARFRDGSRNAGVVLRPTNRFSADVEFAHVGLRFNKQQPFPPADGACGGNVPIRRVRRSVANRKPPGSQRFPSFRSQQGRFIAELCLTRVGNPSWSPKWRPASIVANGAASSVIFVGSLNSSVGVNIDRVLSSSNISISASSRIADSSLSDASKRWDAVNKPSR
jgi:hypothetical protein